MRRMQNNDDFQKYYYKHRISRKFVNDNDLNKKFILLEIKVYLTKGYL